MTNFKNVTVKFQGMRKAEAFVIYPRQQEKDVPEYWTIQSDTRIARVMCNGQVMLSKRVSNGANFIHLNPAMGAKLTEAPEGLISDLRRLHAEIDFNSDGTITILGVK